MRGFIGLTKRNLMIYFKDLGAVFFSLLTSIIVFVLYLVFLKDTYVDAINSFLHGLENIIDAADIDAMVAAILLVGILGSAMITVPFSCLQTLIRDRESKIDYDITSTPIKRYQIILSYFVSSVISAFIITSAILTVGLVVIGGKGSLYMSAKNLVAAYGIVALGSVSATAVFLILALFFKSTAASSAFFGILSAASGFVIGAYIPLSQFSDGVQNICNMFPATQITVLLRNQLLNSVLDKINGDIGGLDQGAFVEGIQSCFTFQVNLFGQEFTTEGMCLYILCALAVSLLGLVAIYTKTYKRN